MAKKLVEGVDYEMVKMKNSNAMTRNIFTKSEKEARAAKAKTKPAAKAKPAAKSKAETAPPKRPAKLNPQSGAAQSGTAGKVKPKSKGEPRRANLDKMVKDYNKIREAMVPKGKVGEAGYVPPKTGRKNWL